MTGKVYLVGAGPGDPELLTLKALRLLKSADIVLHDDLISGEILALVGSSAQLHNVGKRFGQKRISQEEINTLMVQNALLGLQVVRLKSGDPLIFGRAGEEIQALREAHIDFEIVPGITSALGAAANAQIPLTHRQVASAIVLVTGHNAATNEFADWPAKIPTDATVIVYMPGYEYRNTAQQLRRAGVTGDTACAIISRATSSDEQIHVTTVENLHMSPRLPSPTLLVVGEVVRMGKPTELGEHFGWRSGVAETASYPCRICECRRTHGSGACGVKEHLEQVQAQAEKWRPEEILSWAFATFGKDAAIASGFGIEGMVLLDLASRVAKDFRVFTLDTEFLFAETYDLMDRVEKRYGIKVERVFSTLTPEEQEREYGAALWSRDPDRCCGLRKVEPLKTKLTGLKAWITAIRRDQTSSRALAKKVGWDGKFQLIKINPIADWTSEMVWRYAVSHNVPYNPLHDQNYPSIGCTHCTRAILPGENARAGTMGWIWKNRMRLACRRPGPLLLPWSRSKADDR